MTMADLNYLKTSRKKFLATERKFMTDPIGYMQANSNIRITVRNEDGTPREGADLLREYNPLEDPGRLEADDAPVVARVVHGQDQSGQSVEFPGAGGERELLGVPGFVIAPAEAAGRTAAVVTDDLARPVAERPLDFGQRLGVEHVVP